MHVSCRLLDDANSFSMIQRRWINTRNSSSWGSGIFLTVMRRLSRRPFLNWLFHRSSGHKKPKMLK